MATQATIDYCNELLLYKERKFTDGSPARVDLVLFGIKFKIGQPEFVRMSKSEKRRHIREDRMLLTLYAGDEPE